MMQTRAALPLLQRLIRHLQPGRAVPQPWHVLRRNADTLKLLHETEKKLKQQQVEAYVDLAKSAEEQKAGNDVRTLVQTIAPLEIGLHLAAAP